ncbi:autophagy-related protein 2-like [Olea europaea var. sylvestris]|uniref:autophagy-related protein 2-like n=1 Tax=Olea europaea var. sylvestris TaxID=158386 RepID=UPI000C1CEB43|nr:autophagy-related protein 2-like [Olea europaea var. sylvestris]
MFTWSIAKSAEAMFSRLAIKRLCKFLLKKKLGKFILGDIDLNQLDVQLSAGTIQLSDLAVNVDYINQKFNVATVSVKEGSIGSLVVTMPWKDGGCEIEVDDLEIVLTPRQTNIFQDESETSSSCQSKKNYSSHHCRKLENDAVNGGLENASVDVHEGVKTIAKMVKWLLTSFHVKVKNLIVAFDPSMWEEMKEGLCRTAVLRISEVECRTQISEDASSNSGNAQRDFLGLNQLINFVKFEGAAIELLHMDDVDQTPPQCSPVTPYGDWFSGNQALSHKVVNTLGPTPTLLSDRLCFNEVPLLFDEEWATKLTESSLDRGCQYHNLKLISMAEKVYARRGSLSPHCSEKVYVCGESLRSPLREETTLHAGEEPITYIICKDVILKKPIFLSQNSRNPFVPHLCKLNVSITPQINVNLILHSGRSRYWRARTATLAGSAGMFIIAVISKLVRREETWKAELQQER